MIKENFIDGRTWIEMTLKILKNDIAIGDKNVHLIVENL